MIIKMSDTTVVPPASSMRKLVIRNGIANVTRVAIFGFAGFVIPVVLVRRLTPQTYNIWLLMLQLGAYVSFLDFGFQTAVSKFIAEFDARNEYEECGRILSNAVILLIAVALIGILGLLSISLLVPRLFPQIPASLIPEVRVGMCLIGLASAVALPASAFSGVFVGMQRSTVPVTIQSIAKVVASAFIILCVLRQTSLVTMAATVAAVNIAGSFIQFLVWRVSPYFRYGLSWKLRDRRILKSLMRYCGVLAIWTVSMLFIGGLDTTIVAHYDFRSTAYYAISSSITLFLSSIGAAFCGPLIPGISALSTSNNSRELGNKFIRSSRIASVLTLGTMIPPLVFGHFAYDLWLGHNFALNGTPILRILLLSYAIRHLGLPYSTTVLGLGRQWSITWSPVIEGIVNLTCSILLARAYGAIGVAYGTLIGAVVGIGVHFTLGMSRTADVLAIDRLEFVRRSLLRPSLLLIPTLVLFAFKLANESPRYHPLLMLGYVLCTAVIAWLVCLNAADRRAILRHF
jgi:O-antigen/teichoic acid export membrane protein